jgi:hypothetical protein
MRLVVCLGLVSWSAGCNFSGKPSKTVESLLRAVERGEIERGLNFFSTGLISRQGIESLKQGLSQASLELKEHGGIQSIKVLKENVVGEVAEVSVEITRGNGYVATAHYKLIKEKDTWKIDGVTSDSTSEANEPLHPESAVEDVVKWAREAGTSDIRSWFEKRPAPAICKAPPIDRNTLPDEVKYHDVDDAKARERLLSALDPVLKLIACSNREGVVLYKGLNVYAGTLDGGQIAITPGGLYFAGSPPDERIFHELANLRILLAREVFRQIIRLDKPNVELNEADMRLRRDLKLNYLAGLVSLTIDKDPTIFDAAALDIATYAKPVGVVSGTQGTPSLQQIQDIFGAAKQDYQNLR